MEIILAQPRGFCAGVERAVEIVNIALSTYPSKNIYVFHEIVHNKYILSDFRERGVVFVESIIDVPNEAVLIFSAHGVQKNIINAAKNRIDMVVDATCPLVTKVHKEVQKNDKDSREVILIGHKGHQEVMGTMGQINFELKLVESVSGVWDLQVSDENKLSYVTQTTLSMDDTSEIITALKKRFPSIRGPDLKDICYATQNRQNAVKKLAQRVDLILVLGSKNSSNSTRLREIGIISNIPSYLIDSESSIDLSWFQGVTKVGVTAGASAPEILIERTINFLKNKFGKVQISTMGGAQENVKFKLPVF